MDGRLIVFHFRKIALVVYIIHHGGEAPRFYGKTFRSEFVG